MNELVTSAQNRNVKRLENFTNQTLDTIVIPESQEYIQASRSNAYTALPSSFTDSYKITMSKPVFVEKDFNGEESIVYNSNLMDFGKLYKIEFKGEQWALRKNNKTVEIMRFNPDK